MSEGESQAAASVPKFSSSSPHYLAGKMNFKSDLFAPAPSPFFLLGGLPYSIPSGFPRGGGGCVCVGITKTYNGIGTSGIVSLDNLYPA
jgi:hypothetical protein